MCGIAGYLHVDRHQPSHPQLLRRMSDAIAHRGPNGSGAWFGDGIGLAHRRLSIIDLEGGRQPLGNEDDSVQVVFNGEIYNYRELRHELEQRGHVFRTHSDTEVLVHLYEEFGGEMVTRLRGMFAFAIWDSRHRRLLLARDRVGIKPLYFFRNHEWLVFGSELKAVLAHPSVPRDVSAPAIDDYFTYGMIPGSSTIFRGVEKLLPGHLLSVDADRWSFSTKRYWQLNFAPDESLSLGDWREAVSSKLRETVQAHLIADVPVGAFLSGGLDSSMIVADASRIGQPLHTFSMGFREAAFNELPHARAVAEQFGTQHHEELVTPDAGSLLNHLTEYYDEPFADSSAIPTYLVSQLAARHVKVVLSGDGGDEALGGYSRYKHDLQEDSLRRMVPGWLRRSLLAALAKLWPRTDWLPRPLRLKSALTNLSLNSDAAYANTLTLCRQPGRSRLLSADVLSELRGHDSQRIVRESFARTSANDPLSGMIAADMATLLPDDYLVKVDRASMAHGLEVRPPLLDHEFLELCARLPSRWKIRDGETKWLLRELSRDVLPDSIRNRPKQGFEVPLDAWFRGPLREMFADLVLSPNSAVSNLIDPREARRLFDAHQRGTARNGTVLWMLLSLAAWAERYLGKGQAPQNSELADCNFVEVKRFHPPILNSAVPDPEICEPTNLAPIGGLPHR